MYSIILLLWNSTLSDREETMYLSSCRTSLQACVWSMRGLLVWTRRTRNGMESVFTVIIVLEGYRITDVMCVVMMMSVSLPFLPTPLSFINFLTSILTCIKRGTCFLTPGSQGNVLSGFQLPQFPQSLGRTSPNKVCPLRYPKDTHIYIYRSLSVDKSSVAPPCSFCLLSRLISTICH